MENAPIALEYSADALMDFLEYLSKKGLVNSNTIISRKAASNKMLSILTPDEASDLRHLDLDQLAARFANLRGKSYSPQSLQVYKSRVATSLDDFFRYKENPANFKVAGGQPKGASPSGVKAKPKGIVSRAIRVAAFDPAEHGQPVTVSSQTVNFPVPLRTSCVVQINGLPVDLTKAEAAKIAAVVNAMISVSEE